MDIDNFIWEGEIHSSKSYKLFEWQNKKYIIQKQSDYNSKLYCIEYSGILIYPDSDDFLSFLLHDNKLDIYTYGTAEDYVLASKILSLNIEHLLTGTMLNLDLLMPYVDKIESTFNDMKEQIVEIFKQGKQTKRAN